MAAGDDGLVKIASYTGTTDQFSFTGLGGSPYYRGYRIVGSIQQSSSSMEYVRVNFNGATDQHVSIYSRTDGANISHGKQPASGRTSRAYIYNAGPGTGYSGFFTPIIFDIWGDPSNSSGTGYPTGMWLTYSATSSSYSTFVHNYGAMTLNTTGALTSIQFGTGCYCNWSSGSRWDLYGFIGADDGDLFNAWG